MRLFFALWPNPRIQDRLDRAARQLEPLCGGRRIPAANIHITLVFLGEVEQSRLDALRATATTVKAAAFDLSFTKLGWWRRNRVAWAAPEEVPTALPLLVDGLRFVLREGGFQFDPKPYLPHATLLRKANCRDVGRLAEPIPWRVEAFALVRSRLDKGRAGYEIVGRWPLDAYLEKNTVRQVVCKLLLVGSGIVLFDAFADHTPQLRA